MFGAEDHPITVIVERVIWSKAGEPWAVLHVRPDGAGEGFAAAGPFPLGTETGDALRLEGEFEDHPKFGRRFKVTLAHPVRPISEDGIRRYLKSGRVKGIGPKLADRIVAHFGADTLRILDESPERLSEVEGVGAKRVERLVDRERGAKQRREGLVQLQGLGLGPRQAEDLLARLGETEAVAILARDPYALVGQIPRFGFQTADQIAKGLGLSEDAQSRLCAALVHTLHEATHRGHLAAEAGALVEAAAERLKLPAEALRAALRVAVQDGLLEAVRADLPPFAEPRGTSIYLPDVLREEERAATALLRLVTATEPRLLPPPERIDPRGLALSPEQAEAVRTVLTSRVALLTGGPGVGKTTVLRAIVSAWQQQGLMVTLTAPTGRAARRLAESTGFPAATLHKAFGIRPGARDQRDPPLFRTDALVIDEASMLDLPLLAAVLRRLEPGTFLLLVGDKDQLPAVGPGDVVNDILRSQRIPVVRLTKVFRQALDSGIVRNAHRVLHGQMPTFPPRGTETDCFFAERDTGEEGARLVRQLVLERIPKRFGFDPRKDVQVLSPMHRGAAGVQALNQSLQEALGAGQPAVETGGGTFLLGDRVMQTRNDHERELMNGEIGTITSLDAKAGILAVDFDGREVTFRTNELQDLVLAWAVTVHKSQGAEFPVVVLTLFREHHLMLRRAILYTAMTRARRLLVIVASPSALESAVKDTREIARRSEFAHRLMGHPIQAVPPAEL